MSVRTFIRDWILAKDESERLQSDFTISGDGSLEAARQGLFLSGTRIRRQEAISLPSLMAVVRLISEESADKLMSGSLRVVDRDKEEVDLPRFRKAINLMQRPNNFNSGRSFLQDMFADFLLDGNALCYIDRDNLGDPFRLLRCVPEDCRIEQVGADQVYRLRLAIGELPGFVRVQPSRNVVHSLWPRMEGGEYSRAWRPGMGTSPLRTIENTLRIALDIERQLQESLAKGMSLAGKTVFEYPVGQKVEDEKVRAISQGVRQKGRDPAAVYVLDKGAQVKLLQSAPIGEQAQGLREFQVKEIFRAYGLPETLGGVEISSWGQGISQLQKLYEMYCARLHLRTFLEGFSQTMLSGHSNPEMNYPNVRFIADNRGPSLADAEPLVQLYRLLGNDVNRAAISVQEFRSIAGLPPEEVPEDERMRLQQRPVAGARDSEPGSEESPNRRGDRNELRLDQLINGTEGSYNTRH